MEVKRFTEPFLCDALRLGSHLAAKVNGVISEGIGDARRFPGSERIPGDEVRFIRVEGRDYYEIAFLYDREPTPADRKLRNKSFWRVRIGEEIRKLRESRGATLTELSDVTGFRVYSLARIEEGRWDIDIAQIGNILDALGGDIIIGDLK